MAGLALALIARFGSGFVVLWLAYPLLGAYDVGLPPPPASAAASASGSTGSNSRGPAALRWTHHVRQVALGRLGPSEHWVSRSTR